MNKAIILLFISVLYSAQNQRFLYYSKTHGKVEVFALDVTVSGSRFMSYENFKIDSLRNLEAEKQFKDQGYYFIKDKELDNVFLTKDYVTKSYPQLQVAYFTKLGIYSYKVDDSRKIDWQMLPETSVIAGYEVQKAQTEMYGRKWTAWFAPKIMIQDGPYKFHGLPGLIVKITDESGDFDYQLFEVKNLKSAPNYERSKHRPKEDKLMGLDYETYKKFFNENLENPEKFMVAGNIKTNKTVTATGRDKNGNRITKTMTQEALNQRMRTILTEKARKTLEKDLLQ